MRIVKLRFKNLNSLVGQWEIDFGNKRFIDDGIFAIIGPTGAGKSTILDAITLALYAQTPRLGKITKSSNEIMSKGEGECFSEVLFEVNGKEYLAHWQQRRARKRADEALQQPKHEISCDGKILEDKLKEVSKRVEVICGLDFEKMRRSMLLAQGSFDIFLKANANDKAPLLEEITGTEIYSKISIAVHERRNKIKKEFELANERVGAIEILDKSEVEEFEKSLKSLESQNRDLNIEFEALSKVVSDFEAKEKIEQEIKSNQDRLKKIDIKLEEFKPNIELIDKIKRVVEIESSYNRYIDIKRLKSSKERSLESLNLHFGKVGKELEDIKDKKRKQEQELNEAKELQKSKKPLFDEVKKIDLEIIGSKKSLKEISFNLDKKSTQLKSLQKELIESKESLNRSKKQLDELKLKRDKSSHLETLSKDLPIIEKNINRLNELKKSNLEQDLQKIKDDIAQKIKELKELDVKIGRFNEIKKGKKEALDEEQNRLNELIKDGDISTLQDRINSLTLQMDAIKELLYSIKEGQRDLAKQKELDKEIVKLKSNLESLKNNLKQKEQILEELKTKEEILVENIELLRRVVSLEDERARLKEGKPCPLCGSLHHPFAKEATPKIDNKDKELKALQQRVENLQKEINSINLNIAKIQSTIDIKSSQKRELKESFNSLKELFEAKLKELNLPKDKKALEEQSIKIQKEIERLNNQIKRVDKQKELITKAKNELEKSGQEVERLNNKRFELIKTIEVLEEREKSLKQQKQRVDSEIKTIESELNKSIKKYGFSTLDNDILNRLNLSLSEYRAILEAIQKLEVDIAKFDSTIKSGKKQEEVLQQEVNSLQSQVKEQEEKLKKQKEVRFEKFGDLYVESQEQKLQKEIESKEVELKEVEKIYIDLKSDFDKTKSQIDSINSELIELNKNFDSVRSEFFDRLNSSGFKSEDEFLDILSKKDSLSRLEEQKESLESSKKEIIAVLNEKKVKLNEVKKRIEDRDIDSAKSRLNETKEQRDRVLEESGKIKERLEANKRALTLHKKSLQELEAVKKELDRWERLHELIGSSDGKKFRNFAQGLTFDIMIEYANSVLEQMSDRYYLIRDRESLLDLNVIDAYKAGEVRSVKNLSGGESFIVSLALAIGLSKMVSGKVRVDSLFLDEGFGTLDEEALEVALSTLSTLQSQGKLIGIISHVNEIKERIVNQIEVIPKSNGISEIRGVGVKYLGQ